MIEAILNEGLTSLQWKILECIMCFFPSSTLHMILTAARNEIELAFYLSPWVDNLWLARSWWTAMPIGLSQPY